MTLSDPSEPIIEWDLANMKTRPNPFAEQLKSQLGRDEYSAELMARLSAVGDAFDWLNDPAEDIYSDEDGEPV
jgi:hypothetical protein